MLVLLLMMMMIIIIIMERKTSGFDTFIIDRLREAIEDSKCLYKFQYFNSIGFRLSDQFTFLKFYVNCSNCSFTSTYYGNSFHAFVSIFSPDFIHIFNNSVNFIYDGKFMQQFSHSFYHFAFPLSMSLLHLWMKIPFFNFLYFDKGKKIFKGKIETS